LLVAPVASAQTTDTEKDQTVEQDAATSSQLEGTWNVALYFSETAPPSATVMEVTSVNDDGTFEGTFYNTPFEIARYTKRDGVMAFTIITRDGSGFYATSGRLDDNGIIDGQTLATGRDFIMMWSAERAE
ncbi:MAG: hypothetical protein AAFR74_05490, partial [Pseudomonadota bacterium]